MSGGFGPLQALPVNAILEFSLRGEGFSRLLNYAATGKP
jgi:hypothetical protein